MKRFRVRDRIGLLIVAAVFAVSLFASVYGADAPDLRGVYWATEYRAKIQLVGGGELPLTPKGRAVYEKNMTGLKNGSILDEARMVCTPDGPVRNFATPYPFEILQAAPGQVIMIHELNHQIRAIALNTPVPKHEDLMIL